jgi:hypothetical protein
MFGNIFGTRAAHFNPDEPRDWHGRWTSGGSSWRNNPLRDPSPVGRARTFLGHGLAGAFQQGVLREVAYPTQAAAERMSRLLAVWTLAASLDDETFGEHFANGLNLDPKTLRRLRQAVAGAAEARTIGQIIEASYPLTAAIKAIGAYHWPGVLEDLEDRADAARASHAPAWTPVSWTGQVGDSLLSTLNPFGTAYAQRRGSDPGELTPDEELRVSQYNELQEEFSKNGLTYTEVTRPGSIPSWRDITKMRNELNRQLAKRNPSRPSIDELLHPKPPQYSCPVLLDRSPFPPTLDEIYARNISNWHGYEDHAREFGRNGKPITRGGYRDRILSLIQRGRQEAVKPQEDRRVYVRELLGGRTAFYDRDSNTLLIVDPKTQPDNGTMYKPDDGILEFYRLDEDKQ